MTVAQVIKALSKITPRLWVQRTGDKTWTISCEGYEHMCLQQADKIMLESGLFQYDFEKKYSEWDPTCGRTFRQFKLRSNHD